MANILAGGAPGAPNPPPTPEIPPSDPKPETPSGPTLETSAFVQDANYFARFADAGSGMSEALTIAGCLEYEIDITQKLHDGFLLHFPMSGARSA